MQSVLVGAVDEMTPTLQTILGRLGFWKKNKPGEGAAFFLLSGNRSPQCVAELRDMELFNGRFTEEEIKERMTAFLLHNEASDAEEVFPDEYKQYCGEYPVAMSFALWRGLSLRAGDGAPRSILLYNSYLDNHSFLLIRRV